MALNPAPRASPTPSPSRSQSRNPRPCRMIAPIVEQIRSELGDKVTVVKMDIDENPTVPMQLGIMSIPTVIIFKDGKPAERTVGYRPNMKGDLKAKLEALI